MSTYPSGNIRVSDAERDQAIAELSEHYQAGRLTLAEFEERSDQALHSKIGSDLAVLFNDLPRVRRQEATAPVPSPDRLPAAPPLGRLAPLVATLASALVAVAVSLLSVAQPHHRFVVVVPIILWIFVIRRLVHGYGNDRYR